MDTGVPYSGKTLSMVPRDTGEFGEEENMRKAYVAFGLVLAAIAAVALRGAGPLGAQAPSRELPPLQLIQRIPVPGVSGRIDHFTAYPKRRLLIFSGLGNNTVEICQHVRCPGRSQPQGAERTPRRTLRAGIRQDLCGQCGEPLR